jgi:lysophospholipase L1-like esterase
MRRLSLQIFSVGLFVIVGFTALSQTTAEEKDPFARWEKSIAQMEEQDAKSKPAAGGVLFVGSSSIRLWDLHKSFPYDKPLNRGFGGSELADSTHFAARIIIPHKPKKVFLYAGDNDIAKGKSAETVHEDYLKFVQKVHAKLPDAEIIFIAIKPSIKRWELVGEMRKANGLIEAETKKREKLAYADIDKPMIGDDGLPRKDLFLKDGLHLNEAGYKVWNNVMAPFFKDGSKSN